MSWREQYQPGRYRGAVFYTLRSGRLGGRRLALHEYPMRDIPFAEDLGRRARRFELELFVLGDDYMALRDKLLAALEAQGPATLQHPYYGARSASVEQYRVSESTASGGLATFSVTFIETGRATYPTAWADTQARVQARAIEAEAQAQAAFAESFSVKQQPGFVATAATDILTRLFEALTTIKDGFPGQRMAEAGDYLARLNGLSSSAASLIQKPAALAGQISGLASGLTGLIAEPAAAIAGLGRLFDFGNRPAARGPAPLVALPAVPDTTPARRRQAKNQAALRDLVQQAALIAAAGESRRVRFASRQAARATRNLLADAFDRQMMRAEDPSYITLAALNAAVVNDINTRQARLPRIVSYTPTATLPALVLAHRLYGDARKEADIVTRNRTPHPGFVRGGQALEVLA